MCKCISVLLFTAIKTPHVLSLKTYFSYFTKKKDLITNHLTLIVLMW